MEANQQSGQMDAATLKQQLVEQGYLDEGDELSDEELNELASSIGLEVQATAAQARPRFSDVEIDILHGPAQFRFPGAEQKDAVQSFEGTIVATATHKAYFAGAYQQGTHAQPDCSSQDGIHGSREREQVKDGSGTLRDVYGGCADCYYNQFGTARQGQGKACADFRVLGVLVEGYQLPLILRAPPSSIKHVDSYITQRAARGDPLAYSVTTFALHKADPSQVHAELRLIFQHRLKGRAILEVKRVVDEGAAKRMLEQTGAPGQAQLEPPGAPSTETAAGQQPEQDEIPF